PGRDALELAAMIEGEDAERARIVLPRRRAVQVRKQVVLTWPPRRLRSGEENLELLAARHRRRAAVPRHDEGTARVAPPAAVFEGLAREPAGEKARQERVAGADGVEHLDVETGNDDAVLERTDGSLREHDTAVRSTLQHDHPGAVLADGPEGGERIGRSAGDGDLLLGAHQEIAIRQHAPEHARDLARLDVAARAFAVGGEPPQ